MANRPLAVPNLLIALAFFGCSLMGGVVSCAQQKFQSANTKGSCSPIVYGHHNVIECGELSQHDAAILADILNEARSSNRSLAEIKDMLQKALENQDPNKSFVTYWPEGQAVAQNNSGGLNATILEGERVVYVQFLELAKRNDAAGLIHLSEAENIKVPTWYTPYLFEAEAHTELCNFGKAIEYFDFFISKTTGIGNYSELLKKAKIQRAQVQNLVAGPLPPECSTGKH